MVDEFTRAAFGEVIVHAVLLSNFARSRARRSGRSGRRSTPKAMTATVQYVVPVELRDADDGPMLRGVVLQEGRAAAGGRAEVFSPFSVVWPHDGISLRGEHRGSELARVVPTRDTDGSLRVETRATPAILDRVRHAASTSLSSFTRWPRSARPGGVREIQRALIEAAALVPNPEYPNVRAEVRSKRRRVWL